MHVQTKETLAEMTPAKALSLLIEGNQRYRESRNGKRNLMDQMMLTSEGQYPFAVVLGCIDSRVPPELIFDQGIGDIFTVRIAGNFVNEDILGSMEFGCKVVGSRHILVLGHTDCGAIQGVYSDLELGNLTGLLEKLKPTVEAAKQSAEAENQVDLDEIAETNVRMTIDHIQQRSPILKAMLNRGEIGLSGGMYDVRTGKVSFF